MVACEILLLADVNVLLSCDNRILMLRPPDPMKDSTASRMEKIKYECLQCACCYQALRVLLSRVKSITNVRRTRQMAPL